MKNIIVNCNKNRYKYKNEIKMNAKKNLIQNEKENKYYKLQIKNANFMKLKN